MGWAARPATRTTVRLAVAVALLLAGCTPEGPAAPGTETAQPADGAATIAPGSVPDPDDVDPARLEPLDGLPTCPSPPTAVDADVGDLPLPVDAVVTSADVDGSLQSIQGFTPRTPVQVLVDYLRLDGWSVLSAEDEVFEAELLLERDGLRVFAKAQANCSRGSAFVLFGSRDPALVPAPQGAGG